MNSTSILDQVAPSKLTRKSAEPMRITFVVAELALNGGVRVIATHARKLQQRGHHVTLVYPPVSVNDKVRSMLKGHGWPSVKAAQNVFFEDSSVEHHVLNVCRPVTEADVPDADVIVATWWKTAHWIESFSSAKGAKAILIQGYETDAAHPNPQLDQSWRMPFQKIVVSRWLTRVSEKQFGDRGSILVPNAVETTQFNAPVRGKQKQPTFGLVYSRNPAKGTDISLAAFAAAQRALPQLKLVVFGSEHPTRALPIPSDVEFVSRPAQASIKDLYASCDAWLFGSRQEGFGLPILEAMACRTPVIATPAGAAPELLASGGGFLVKQESVREMTDAIGRIVAMDDQKWKEMSSAAHLSATSYSWDDAAEQFEAALRMAIVRGKSTEA